MTSVRDMYVQLIRSAVIFHKSLHFFLFQIKNTLKIPQLIICGLINDDYIIGLDLSMNKIEVLYIVFVG